MPLHVIKEKFDLKPEVIHSGWKPYVDILEFSYHPAFIGCKILKEVTNKNYRHYLLKKLEHIPGHWRKDEKRFDIRIVPSFDIRDQMKATDTFYQTGFHVFDTSQDVEAYCNSSGITEIVKEIGSLSLQYLKVDYTDIVAKGTYNQIGVTIAKQVKIRDIPTEFDRRYYHPWGSPEVEIKG